MRAAVAAADNDAESADNGCRPLLLVAGFSLLLAGFITNLAGAPMLVGPVRRRFGATLERAIRPGQTGPGSPQVLDLAPEEWHQIKVERPWNTSRNAPKRGRAP
jgi:UPF0716 family protein affecting phage T7 exclusion